jgi:hypothetical protein
MIDAEFGLRAGDPGLPEPICLGDEDHHRGAKGFVMLSASMTAVTTGSSSDEDAAKVPRVMAAWREVSRRLLVLVFEKFRTRYDATAEWSIDLARDVLLAQGDAGRTR